VLGHVKPEARRNHVQKLVQFILAVQVALGLHHELSHITLQVFRQLHVLHGSVSHINLLLETLSTSIERLGDHCDGSEDVCVNQSSTDQQRTGQDVLKKVLGVNVVASQHQDGVVERNDVLHVGGFFFVEVLWVVEVVFVVGQLSRLPTFIDVGDVEEQTGCAVDVQDQVETQLEQLKTQFNFVSRVHVVDDARQPEHSE